MPNIALTPQMQDWVDRQVAAGLYGNASEVARAGLRRLMQDDGAAAYELLKHELRRRIKDEPTVEVDLREEFLADLTEEEPAT